MIEKTTTIPTVNSQRGAASLFVVVFAAMLLSVITISFIGLMLREQNRSIDNELSQSAYDSALAGVEDAKRVIARCNADNDPLSAACRAIDDEACDTVQKSLIIGSATDSEVPIQSTVSGDNQLNQAYTCVKITQNSPNYVTKLNPMSSEIVALRGAGTRPIVSIEVEWHLQSLSGDGIADVPTLGGGCASGSSVPLCSRTQWDNYPALMRLQAITPDGSINLDTIDNKENSNTAFLYPSVADSMPLLSGKDRYAPGSSGSDWSINEPLQADCDGVLIDYLCSSVVTLPQEVAPGSNLAVLRLTSLYKSATVRITLLDSAGQRIDFDGIQPIADSTGRANDVFRRVAARLSLVNQVAYPENAIDLGNSLCKNFSITDDATEVAESGTCTP